MPTVYTGTADMPFAAGKGLRQIEMEKESYTRGRENAEFELKKQQIEQNRVERELEREWREKRTKIADERYDAAASSMDQQVSPQSVSGYTPSTELGGVTPAREQTIPTERPSPFPQEASTPADPLSYGFGVPSKRGYPTREELDKYATDRGLDPSQVRLGGAGGVPGSVEAQQKWIAGGRKGPRPESMTRAQYKTYQKYLAKNKVAIEKADSAEAKWQAEQDYKKKRDAMKDILDSAELSKRQKNDELKRILERDKLAQKKKEYDEEITRFEEKEEIRAGLRTPKEKTETPDQRRAAQEKITIAAEKRARIEKQQQKTETGIEGRWFVDKDGNKIKISDKEKPTAQRDIDTVNKIYDETGYPYHLELRYETRGRNHWVADYVPTEGGGAEAPAEGGATPPAGGTAEGFSAEHISSYNQLRNQGVSTEEAKRRVGIR